MRPNPLVLLPALTLLSASAFAETYRFTVLNPSAPNYRLEWPQAINDRGDVLFNGINTATQELDAIFILDKHGFKRVQFPGTQPSTVYGTALSADGTVGGVMLAEHQTGGTPFELRHDGKLTMFPTVPAGSNSNFYGMNDRGDFTTTGVNGSSTQQPYFFTKGAYTAIQYQGVTYYTADGISNDGTVVGTLIDLQAGYTLRKGVFTLFRYPGADGTHAECISDSGHYIAGSFFVGSDEEHGYVLRGQRDFTQVDFPAPQTINGTYGVETLQHFSTGITGINDKGEICGISVARYGSQTGTEVVEFWFTAEPKHGP